MNKTKKGFLSAASILTIVASAFGILGGIILMFVGSICDDDLLKDIYKDDPEYIYCENVDGSYYFTYLDDEGVEAIIYPEDIEIIAKIASGILNAIGFIALGLSVAKLVLAIRILVVKKRDLFPKGTVIALMVLSILDSSMLEAVFLIVTLCLKDEQPKEEINNPQQDVVTIDLEDIK